MKKLNSYNYLICLDIAMEKLSSQASQLAEQLAAHDAAAQTLLANVVDPALEQLLLALCEHNRTSLCTAQKS